MVTYKLIPSIACKIFNLKKFVSEVDLNLFMDNPQSIPCNCSSSTYYIDKHHKHIVTGDLSFIQDKQLRRILEKGPKFRSTKAVNFVDAQKSIVEGISQCVDKWCKRNGEPFAVLSEWLTKVKELIDTKVLDLSKRIRVFNNKIDLNNKSVLKSLKDLHHNYILAPIDKATGNISIIL